METQLLLLPVLYWSPNLSSLVLSVQSGLSFSPFLLPLFKNRSAWSSAFGVSVWLIPHNSWIKTTSGTDNGDRKCTKARWLPELYFLKVHLCLTHLAVKVVFSWKGKRLETSFGRAGKNQSQKNDSWSTWCIKKTIARLIPKLWRPPRLLKWNQQNCDGESIKSTTEQQCINQT